MRAGGDRLGDIAGVADAAVADHRDTGALSASATRRNRADLRHADAGNHAGRADRARADPDLDRVRARLDEIERRLGGHDVAADDLHVRDISS